MSFGARLTGGRELQARFREMGELRQVLGKVGLTAVAGAKANVPRRTGNLARTIRLGTVTDGYVEVHAGGRREVGYAAAVEFGSRPHVIVPRRAKVLAWGGARTLGGRLQKGARAEFFARRVNHPGSRPRPYLFPAIREAAGKVMGLVVEAWNRGG